MSQYYRHLTLDDRVEIELRLTQRESQATIARALRVHRSTISREVKKRSWQPEHDHVNPRGLEGSTTKLRPTLKGYASWSPQYLRLVQADRYEIEKFFGQGHSQAEIARSLGGRRSTISREIRKRSCLPEHHNGNRLQHYRNKLTPCPYECVYLAGQAQHHTNTRKARSHKS